LEEAIGDLTAEDRERQVVVSSHLYLVPGLQNLFFGDLILDKAHYLRNPRSAWHQLVRVLPHKAAWFATATAILNQPIDVKGYLNILFGHIGKTLTPNHLDTIDRYSNPYDNDFPYEKF